MLAEEGVVADAEDGDLFGDRDSNVKAEGRDAGGLLVVVGDL